MEFISISNALLGALGRQDQMQILAEAELVPLRQGAVLAEPGQDLETIYFVERGFLSVVATGPGRDQVEIAQVGREGMLGVPVVLGGRTASFRWLVQSEG